MKDFISKLTLTNITFHYIQINDVSILLKEKRRYLCLKPFLEAIQVNMLNSTFTLTGGYQRVLIRMKLLKFVLELVIKTNSTLLCKKGGTLEQGFMSIMVLLSVSSFLTISKYAYFVLQLRIWDVNILDFENHRTNSENISLLQINSHFIIC